MLIPPIRVVQRQSATAAAAVPPEPANRPLHLLLMATSPDYPGLTYLQYEQEEANILQATRDQPLRLVVEESGSVPELTNLVRFYPERYFDVFHLTGHGLIYTEQEFGTIRAKIQAALIADQTPCFVTEDELGGLQLTTAADLARAFGNRFPKLVFLSGCHTGEVPDQGTVPSMAQELVQAGVPIVLGWARPVRDTTATVAAKALYQSLAAGDAVFQDYRLLGTIARAEQMLGQVSEALSHYQQALDDCPEDDLESKATMLNNTAGVIAAQGDIEPAMQLWNQSLELFERIGNVQGKAVTLGNMANIAHQQGETERAIELLEQCVQALGQTRAYVDLVTGLGNLAVIDSGNQLIHRAQAIWLCLRIQAPLVKTIQLVRGLFNAVPQGDALAALLAATALWFCNARGTGHPQLTQLQEDSFKLLTIAASAQGIETQEAWANWFTEQPLNDPDYFLPQLNQRLEEMIGDGWRFNPNAVR